MTATSRGRDADRIISSGAVGFAFKALNGRPFYVNFESVAKGTEVLVEISFNPETVVIDEKSSDLIVEWGRVDKMREWVSQFCDEFEVALCPPSSEERIKQLLFGPDSVDITFPNMTDPWRLGDDDLN